MPEAVRKVRPTPTRQFMANPHRGCCTHQALNGEPLFVLTQDNPKGHVRMEPSDLYVADGYLPCTVAYFRFFWTDLQPAEDRFDFSPVEKALEGCRQAGQTLIVRIMPYGGRASPQLPAWYAKKYLVERGVPRHEDIIRPDHDSAEYLNIYGNLLRELGSRFDEHPQFEGLDMSFVGPWGEGGVAVSLEQCERFAKLYQETFPNSFRFSLTDHNLFTTAIPTGAGWRADSFGDDSRRGSPAVSKDVSWNHMYDLYPAELGECRAWDVWKGAPVLLETWNSPKVWNERGFDIPFILQQGLKYHATYFNPKYTAIPPRIFDAVEDFCDHLGYNFIYRQAWFDCIVKTTGKFKFRTWIENVGVAPLYRHYDFALRLRQGDREEIMLLDGVDTRTWLPGDIWINREIPLPQGFKPGNIEIAAGIVDPESGIPRVSFSVQENFSDRWMSLGWMELTE
jgi:hypothetical protein